MTTKDIATLIKQELQKPTPIKCQLHVRLDDSYKIKRFLLNV